MKATEILIEEHGVIERVLDALEAAVDRLRAGSPLPRDFFLQAAEFIEKFADGCHHRKEEGVLFEALVANGMPREMGPVAVMLAEHEEGRRWTRAMREAAARLQGGDPEAKMDVIENALGYAGLLRQHIQKENRILFPMAGQMLPPSEQERVNAEFDRLGNEEVAEGVREKHLRLADELAKTVAT